MYPMNQQKNFGGLHMIVFTITHALKMWLHLTDFFCSKWNINFLFTLAAHNTEPESPLHFVFFSYHFLQKKSVMSSTHIATRIIRNGGNNNNSIMSKNPDHDDCSRWWCGVWMVCVKK